MSQELAVTADTVLVLPHSGELINLNDAPTVARHLTELRELDDKIREAKRILNDALALHAQRVGAKTLYLEGVGKAELTGGPGSLIVWDIEILELLRDAGLPEDRFNELVTTEVTFKVNASVARSIAGSNPKYREIIDVARKRVDKAWSARIT